MNQEPVELALPRSAALALLWCCMLTLTSLVPAHAGDVRAVCRTTYDGDYFYLAAEVEKSVLQGTVSTPFQDPYGDDCIAVYLAAFPAGQSAGQPTKRVEMAVSVAQAAQLYRGLERTPLRSVEDFVTASDGTRLLFKYRLRPKGPLNAQPDPTNGFVVELAIPWAEFGGLPTAGEELRFNVAILSTTESDPEVVSFSPDVKTREQLADPHRWARLVLTDAPVSHIPGAPGAVVCARAFNVRPVVDGTIGVGEWSRITAFSFAAGSEARTFGMGTAATARRRPEVGLKPPTPPGSTPGLPPIEYPEVHSTQQWPRLIFARYLVGYQSDSRKNLPHVAAYDASGQSLLVTHPMDGTGPWFSYDRLDWHRIQLTRMREAGVDVAAVSVRPTRQARLALSAMGSALQAMDENNMDYPQACLWLEAQDLHARPDLAVCLYDALRTFVECVPEPYRLRVPLSGDNGPGFAEVMVLSGMGETDAAVIPQLRRLVRERQRCDLIVLSAGEELPGADAVVPSAETDGYAIADGLIRVAALCAGSPGRAPGEHPLARRSAVRYREAWRQVLRQTPAWIFIESWNDHSAATEITPTVEFGLEYLDTTRAHAARFTAGAGLGGRLLSANVPPCAAAGITYMVSVVLRNTNAEAWLPNSVALQAVCRGRPLGSSVPITEATEMGQPVRVPLRLTMPDSPGQYDLELQLIPIARKGERRQSPSSRAVVLGTVRVRVVQPSELGPQATLVRSSLTRAVEAQGTYPLAVTFRNDGPAPWPVGTLVTTRLFTHAPLAENAEAADMAGASVPLNAAVPPGEEVTVTVPTTFARADGSPFRFSGEDTPRYLVRFDVDLPGENRQTLPTHLREVQIVEVDPGVQFFNDHTPSRVPADRRVPVPIGVRNRGPQTWVRDQVAVGYHWYYLDGVEAVWEDEVFPLKVDVPPGNELGDIGAWLTAPPHDGTYWLVWDLRIGDTWVSTLPGVRTYESRVMLVHVVSGRLHFVDLQPVANVRGAGQMGLLDRSGFDGQGRSLAAELTPPYALSAPTPATLWLPEIRSGIERSRQISFHWLPSSGPNAVRCDGQRVEVAPPRTAPVARKLHILAAATTGGKLLELTLHYADSSEDLISVPVDDWSAPPGPKARAAHSMPYSRLAASDEVGPPVAVYWYTIPIRDPRKLVAMTLGKNPEIRLLAVTVER